MRPNAILVMPAFILLTGPAIVFASAPETAGEPLLVISGWGTAAEQIIGQAGGRIYGPVRAPLGVLATSDNPAFADNLRAAGAWAVLDGSRIATLCGAGK